MREISLFRGYRRQIKLEFNYDEVKDGVPNASRQMAMLNAEFRKSYEEANASGKALDKLGVRYDFLSEKIKIQEQDVEKWRKKLEEAEKATGNNSKAIQNNTASLEIAEAKLGQTRAQLQQVSEELEKNKTILGKTSDEWKDLGDKTTAVGKEMTMKLTVPIMAAATASFKLGADFEQALGKMEVVFEDNAKAVENWAQNALKDFGLARSTAITMASDFGALFKGMGISLEQTQEWSTTLTERTMDLANFYDTTVDETTRALEAIVTGQTEPLRRFGINMTQATLQEYAYAQGIRKKVADMTEAEKVQLRYNFVIERTNIAVGTTAREADTATGQLNRFKETTKELGIAFSEEILPIFTPIIGGITNVIEKIAGLNEGTKKFIVYGALVVAAIGPILVYVGKLFDAIGSINSGLKLAKGAVGAVQKGGTIFSGALNNSAFFGFAKWAVVIAGVAAAIGFVIYQLNTLLGKGEQASRVLGTLGPSNNVIGQNITQMGIRGYAVGSNYIKRDQIAMVHEGEAIIPAESNPWNPNAKRYDNNNSFGQSHDERYERLLDRFDKLITATEKMQQSYEDNRRFSRMGEVVG